MDLQSINVGGIDLQISSTYQKLQTLPDDKPGTVCYGMATQHAQAMVVMFPINLEETMPLNNEASVINGIHQCLAETQGLIEVKSINGSNNSRCIYSIIKNKKEPSGVQYFLRLNYVKNGKAVEIQGFFDEVGVTGMRDSQVFELAQRQGAIKIKDNGVEGWNFDPYDQTYTRGFLMNLSEQEQLDEYFPQHPLSIARTFIRNLDGEE